MAKRKRDGEDIISNLPDLILSHILSFLPTKEAARTTLLSKSWRHSWTCITRLDFRDESQYKCHARITREKRFLELVDRILQQQILTPSINSFTLCLSNSEVQYSSHSLNALIYRVLEQKVQKLSIRTIMRVHLYDVKRVSVFPSAVFNSGSLIELDIRLPTSLRFPSSNCLTNLQVLRFGDIKFSRDRCCSSKEVMLSFPVLKVFEIDHCTLLDVKVLIIDTPTLESLVIRYPIFEEKLANGWSRVSGTIKLLALRLRKFFYYGDLEEGIILSNRPLTVINALINVRRSMIVEKMHNSGVKTCMLLKELHESVKYLELGPYMIQTLVSLKGDLPRLPLFERLVSLVLTLWTYPLPHVLLNLLQKSPNLRRLELNARLSGFGTVLSSSKDVPHCIQYNLKDVKILCEWNEDKFQFVKYMLGNARVLDQLTISLKAGVRKVFEELQYIPKASSSVQIKVKRTTKKELEELSDKCDCNLV